ncbi:MAG: hypothetical protein GW809_04455 [Bacteroidetes bacterium]|nr:hypothetical protein [Bacteroidota bacterium]NCQ11395.1 hypothetical protein [Bacteroidota bacterium]
MLKNLTILAQPDDVTCGPTSLQAVYSFFGENVDLNDLITEIEMLEGGGTLAVYLGIHAMKLGYKATVYSYNLRVFDPSWFSFNSEQLIKKLKKQLEYKDGKKFTKTCNAYLEFLEKGGTLRFDNLEPQVIQQYTSAQLPVIAGLSSTYLYPSKREFETRNNKIIYDDVRGEPTGHFVVVKEINEKEVWIADPYQQNPYNSANREYKIPVHRFINSVMLGVITYDANLLILEK